jgi:hypothetical protein
MTDTADLKTIEGVVTDIQHFPKEISGTCNDTKKPKSEPRPSPNHCCCCEKPFADGQTRFPIIFDEEKNWHKHSVDADGGFYTRIASVCMDCFKLAYDDHNWWQLGQARGGNSAAPRHNTKCEGCGEPIQTIINPRRSYWRYCSNRC